MKTFPQRVKQLAQYLFLCLLLQLAIGGAMEKWGQGRQNPSLLLLFATDSAMAQTSGGPPELPPIPFAAWDFLPLESPPWADWFGDLPKASTNLVTAPSWDYDGTALSVDTNVAFLQFDYF